MKFPNSKIKILLASAGILEAVFYLTANTAYVFAQTELKFLVSWKAADYVPADFQGKILPSASSQIETGFDLIDSGKIADLSGKEISWYLNNNFLRSGIGLKTISFPARPTGQILRLVVSNYGGRDLDYALTLPTANPEIIIDAKTASPNLKLGNHFLTAWPYFFNVLNLSDLSFSWKINNQPPTNQAESSNKLSLDLHSPGIPKEADLFISATAQNILNQLEMASGKINFKIR